MIHSVSLTKDFIKAWNGSTASRLCSKSRTTVGLLPYSRYLATWTHQSVFGYKLKAIDLVCVLVLWNVFLSLYVLVLQTVRPCRQPAVLRKCRNWFWTCCPGCVGPRLELREGDHSGLAGCWADWRSYEPSVTTTSSWRDSSLDSDGQDVIGNGGKTKKSLSSLGKFMFEFKD